LQGVFCFSGWDGQVISWIQCVVRAFLAEAAMIACNIQQTLTVNSHSKNGMIGTMIVRQYHDSLLKRVRNFIAKGFDKAPSASAKRDNIKNANLEEYISIEEKISLIQRKQE
jgi:putative N6-adenine-specific DNA methylase